MSVKLVVCLCACLCVQNIVCQFGFFPNERRQRQPSFGFQNFPYPRRVSQKLSSWLNPQTENQEYYPYNQPNNYPYDTRYDSYPNNNVRFPNRNTYDYVNFDSNRPTEGYNDNTFNYNQNAEDSGSNSKGLSFEDFITGSNTNPTFGDTINHSENPTSDANVNNNDYEVKSTTEAFKDFKDETGHAGDTISSGIITGPVSNEPVFGGPDNPLDDKEDRGPSKQDGFILSASETPSFGDRNGEDEASSSSLPTLTPVPLSASRDNGAAAAFSESCTTVDNAIGSCIRIQDCAEYFKLLQNPRDRAVVNILRRSQCGFEGDDPKVCCPPIQLTDEVTTVAPTTTTAAVPTTVPPASGKSLSDLVTITALPVPPDCGISNASFSRVVNGVPAKLGDFPWMALLGYKGRRGNPTRWLCGGSLITPHHVLTAAHCIHTREDDLYVVRLGELDLAREDDGAKPIDVLIKSLIKHEKYDSMAFTNDIGLVVLERDVQFSDLIRPICIPQDENLRAQTFEKYNPLLAGWGDVEYRGPSASHLQVAQLPVVSNAKCARAYSQYKAQVIDTRVLCAGWDDARQDACQGDSGGPLMQPIWNAQTYKTYFFQTGVVSFGKKCAEPGFPGVYTRVTHFVPWIQEKVLSS